MSGETQLLADDRRSSSPRPGLRGILMFPALRDGPEAPPRTDDSGRRRLGQPASRTPRSAARAGRRTAAPRRPFRPGSACAVTSGCTSVCPDASAVPPVSRHPPDPGARHRPVVERLTRSGDRWSARGTRLSALDPRAQAEQLDVQTLQHVAGAVDAHALDDRRAVRVRVPRHPRDPVRPAEREARSRGRAGGSRRFRGGAAARSPRRPEPGRPGVAAQSWMRATVPAASPVASALISEVIAAALGALGAERPREQRRDGQEHEDADDDQRDGQAAGHRPPRYRRPRRGRRVRGRSAPGTARRRPPGGRAVRPGSGRARPTARGTPRRSARGRRPVDRPG